MIYIGMIILVVISLFEESFGQPQHIKKNIRNESFSIDFLKRNISDIVDRGLEQIDSVLMLQKFPNASSELKSGISMFKDSLIFHLEQDLQVAAKEFAGNHIVNYTISDTDIYSFKEKVQDKWEKTLASDLLFFQETMFPRWFIKYKNVWTGIEKRVIAKVDKFKSFVKRLSFATQGTCARKRHIFGHAISSLNDNSEKNKLLLSLSAQFLAVFLAVLGFVILPFGAPIWLCLILVVIGEFLNFYIGAYLVLRLQTGKDDVSQSDQEE